MINNVNPSANPSQILAHHADRSANRSRFSTTHVDLLEPRRLFAAQALAAATDTTAADCGCGDPASYAPPPKLSEATVVKLQRSAIKVASAKDSTLKSVTANAFAPLSSFPRAGKNTVQTVAVDAAVPFKVNIKSLRSDLASAPMEFTDAATTSPLLVTLPNPNGTLTSFRVWESPVVESLTLNDLARIKTYEGQGIDDPTQVVRFDVSDAGVHATVIGASGTWYIDPLYHRQTNAFISYNRNDAFVDSGDQSRSEAEMDDADALPDDGSSLDVPQAADGDGMTLTSNLTSTGTQLRMYRLAMATTAEYTAFQGGTVAALGAVVAVVNRLNTVYETDLTIRLVLVANDNLIIHNASNDPYTNPDGSPSTTNTQNQTELDSKIGNANYDVGHVLHKAVSGGDNGLAGGIGSVGVNSIKGKGFSSMFSPTTDPFTIDYVAHELGHQFGARHLFANCGGGAGDSTSLAVEPGSGSSIMSYAGICGASYNLQAHSDAMFNQINIDQITTYVESIPAVGSRTATGNTIPTLSAGANYTIPINTPFTLTATASDPDGDALTYSWEQANGYNSSVPAVNYTGADGPNVRPLAPVTSPSRTVPPLENILNNTNVVGIRLPTVARTMNWAVTARDNRAGGGGVAISKMIVTVSGTTAFSVATPNTAVSYDSGSTQTVTWIVGQTNAAPISTANVNILLSTDGGNTFPYTLAAATPNDGSQSITIPAGLATSTARVKIEAVGNIYFDISNTNFTIVATTPAAPNTPTLTAASDTGISNSDGITKLNNSSPATALTFNVSGVTSGNTVSLFSGATLIGSAVASGTSVNILTNGSSTLADGTATLTAVQSNASGTSTASGSLAITIDTSNPFLTSYGISPTVRNAPVSSATLAFSEPVANFSLANLALTRDGLPVSLASATLTPAGSNIILANVASLTSATAIYQLSSFTATSTDVAGNALVAASPLTFANNVIVLPANPSENTLRLVPSPIDPAAINIYLNSPSPTYSWTFSPGQLLRIDGSTGADRIQFDGNTVQTYNPDIKFNPNGGSDTLDVRSGVFAATYNLGASTAVNVFSNAAINFNTPQTLSALSLATASTAVANSSIALDTLAIANDGAPLGTRQYTAFVDLTNSSLVVHNGDPALLSDAVRAWRIALSTGLGSSAIGRYNTLAVFPNAIPGSASPFYSSFASLPLVASDVLVRFDYNGDLNADGVVDANDVRKLIEGLSTGATGWQNGDINYDGIVNAADYALLNASLNADLPPL